eukprot:scaffold64367_cov48-Attheya_sp.AAC.1
MILFFTSSPTDYLSVPAPQDRLIRRRVNQDTNILKLAPRLYLSSKEPILSRIALVVTHNLIGTRIYHHIRIPADSKAGPYLKI